MLAEQKETAVTAQVTVTLEVSLESLPGGAPLSAEQARDFARQAAESFTAVSYERRNAFNQITQLRRGATSQVTAVEATCSNISVPQFEGKAAND
ncbi:hypothetical protein [Breoghania sp.]|uniref:hypothetical protein n=1 Tax=Breoghania sp. TaxID=2065378 RepID=UPI002AA93777|nr:hypothetical protein [Breoghania sp.]